MVVVAPSAANAATAEQRSRRRSRMDMAALGRSNMVNIALLPPSEIIRSMDTRTRLAARVQEIAPFHVMEVQTAARALEAAGRDIVHLEIGEPDFPTPEPVLEAARRALADGRIYYTSALGLPALRTAIARHYADHYGVAIAPERVIVTAGSSAALLLVMALI